MKQHLWKDEAKCLGSDTNLFFEIYEDNIKTRDIVDQICLSCPVIKICFANGISGKEWGIWGGVYLEGGEVSKEFNNHKTKEQWGETWKILTMETK